MMPITLNDKQLQDVLACLTSNGREYGAARMARLLGGRHSQKTVVVNQIAAVGNLSDCVTKHLNPKIAHLGLFVACVKPPVPIKNRFNQTTGQCYWSFYTLAANDDFYDQSLEDDLNAISEVFPELKESEKDFQQLAEAINQAK